jgi:hypothetical protein
MALYKIRSSRVNNIDADQYTGSVVEEGLIWYDPETGVLRLYNGDTGGYIINSGGGATNQISSGDSNVTVNSDGRVTISVNGVANVAVFEGPRAQFDSVFSTGNVTTDGYFVGDGAGISNIAGSNITGTVSNSNTANIAIYANTAGFANSAGSANLANTANSATIVTGNVQTNIRQLGTLVSLAVSGNVVAAANISGNYLFGNGYFLSGISGGGGNASFPIQTGNAGLVLMTNGSDTYWNSGLASSYTFDGGQSEAEQNAILNGGGASTDYTGEAMIFGGAAGSDYSLTLSSLALTGQYADLEDAPATTSVPATVSTQGQKGQMAFDSNHLYVCIAANTWRRATLNSW